MDLLALSTGRWWRRCGCCAARRWALCKYVDGNSEGSFWWTRRLPVESADIFCRQMQGTR